MGTPPKLKPSGGANGPSTPFCCSVTQSRPSDSFQPHGQQHARFSRPSPSPGACSNSRPLHQCFHPPISSSVVPFSSHLQSFPASGSFPMSLLFAPGGQIIFPQISPLEGPNAPRFSLLDCVSPSPIPFGPSNICATTLGKVMKLSC